MFLYVVNRANDVKNIFEFKSNSPITLPKKSKLLYSYPRPIEIPLIDCANS